MRRWQSLIGEDITEEETCLLILQWQYCREWMQDVIIVYIYIPHIRYVTTGVLGTTNEGAKCIISQCTILWVFECRIDMFAGQIFMLVAISISTTTATVGTIPDLTTILGWTSIAIECAPLQDTSHNWKTNMVDFQLAMSVHRTKYQLSNE